MQQIDFFRANQLRTGSASGDSYLELEFFPYRRVHKRRSRSVPSKQARQADSSLLDCTSRCLFLLLQLHSNRPPGRFGRHQNRDSTGVKRQIEADLQSVLRCAILDLFDRYSGDLIVLLPNAD